MQYKGHHLEPSGSRAVLSAVCRVSHLMTDKHTASDARKAALRTQLRQQRNALSDHQQQAAASSAAEFLTQHPEWANARSIVLYQAADGELDPTPIAARARTESKQLFLPVINGTGLLAFHPWEEGARLIINQYGIRFIKSNQAFNITCISTFYKIFFKIIWIISWLVHKH